MLNAPPEPAPPSDPERRIAEAVRILSSRGMSTARETLALAILTGELPLRPGREP